MEYIKNDMPSMDNIYQSQYYNKTKDYEQSLANNSYQKAKYPFKTGVVPSPAYSSMFSQPFINEDDNNSYINSLSGEKIPLENFTHKNMQHFLRKGITQNTDVENPNFNQKIGYNDYKTRKTEVETFFQPTTDMSYLRGMNNNSDFILDRTNPSKNQNNYNPIQSIRVAPGLNQGFTSSGTGGFHQADSLLYAKPKDRDELRPITDQRNSIFEIPIQAPMKSSIDKRGVVEPFSKNKPETTYKQTEENWFKGQSYLKKDTNRPVENLKDTSRIGTHTDYYGSLKNQEEFQNPNEDYGKNSVIVYNTNKHELSKQEVPIANLTTTLKAFVAPITDALKISLKEFFINPEREFGYLSPQQPDKATTYDPINHIMKTTIKETTIDDNNSGILTGNKETYSALYDNAKTTVKETTIDDDNSGNLSGNKETYSALYDDAKKTTKETFLFESEKTNLTGNKETYSALYDDAKTTVKETTIDDDNLGNLSGNKETYSALYDDAKTTVKETTIDDDNLGNLSGNKETYSALYDSPKTTIKETNIHDEYSGNIKGNFGTYLKNNDKTKTTLKQTIPKQDTSRNIKNVIYKSTYVYDPSIVAKTTLKETTINNPINSYGFIGGFLNKIIGGYIIKNDNAKNTQRQFSHIEYDGSLKSAVTFVPMDREADMNAEIDGTREMILINAGHTPNGAGNFTSIDKKDVNLSNKKQLDLYEEQLPSTNANKVYQIAPLNINEEAITKIPIQDNAYKSRLDSSVLSSLIENEDVIKINPII